MLNCVTLLLLRYHLDRFISADKYDAEDREQTTIKTLSIMNIIAHTHDKCNFFLTKATLCLKGIIYLILFNLQSDN